MTSQAQLVPTIATPAPTPTIKIRELRMYSPNTVVIKCCQTVRVSENTLVKTETSGNIINSANETVAIVQIENDLDETCGAKVVSLRTIRFIIMRYRFN